jgi:hypothetical protein
MEVGRGLSELFANRVAYGDLFLVSLDSTGEGVVRQPCENGDS